MARFVPKKTSVLPVVPDQYEHGYKFSTRDYVFIAKPGISQNVIEEISDLKAEPKWMRQQRLTAHQIFTQHHMPQWGADLAGLDFTDIRYYLRPVDQVAKDWNQVPATVKTTFERLKIPEAERQVLAGVKAQYDSEVVYGSLQKTLQQKGVIFLSMDEAVKKHPDLVKKYFGKIIPASDNIFAALNSAVWSGGSFVYVPPGVEVGMPLQTYFRINSEKAGQFERTLIIVDEEAKVHYVEGCTAPQFSTASLHSAVVEIIVKKGATCQYTTVQNWYKNVYNLVTKRARVEAEGTMIWTDCNLGSRVTMKYPSCILAGPGARGETLSIAMASSGQHQDTGAKMIHLAPHTSSNIVSKSISIGGGRTSYRGLTYVAPDAHHSQNSVVCDALLLDSQSRSDTYPTEKIFNSQVAISHEATVSKIGDDQLFYLMSRGVDEETARKMIVRGFVAGVVKTLPIEYAVEMNRLIEFEMEGSIG